jgi:hypothetical protein
MGRRELVRLECGRYEQGSGDNHRHQAFSPTTSPPMRWRKTMKAEVCNVATTWCTRCTGPGSGRTRADPGATSGVIEVESIVSDYSNGVGTVGAEAP